MLAGVAGAVLSLRCASQHSGVGVSCRQTSTRARVPLCAGQGVCACYTNSCTTTTFLLSVLLSMCVLSRPSLQTRSSSGFSFAAFLPIFSGALMLPRVHRLCTCRSSGTLTAPGYLLRASLLGSLGAVMSILSSPGIPRASSPARCFFRAVAQRGAPRRQRTTR